MPEHLKILLIEDDPECALLVEALLKSACRASLTFELKHAGRLQQGLALLREGRFDVLLLDLGLPDSRGLATLASARAGAGGVPIVVLTGLGDEELGLQAIAGGAQDFLSKGRYDSDQLRHVIRFALERGRMQARFEHALECLPDGVIVAGLDGVVRYANPAAAVLFNTPLALLVGRPFPHPLGPEAPAELRLRVGTQGERVLEFSPAKAEWERCPVWLVSIRDVTILKMVERLRAEAQEREDRQEARERFLQGVVHELRSPLTVAAAAIERLRELAAPGPDRTVAELGLGALRRLLRFVDKLLALWRAGYREAGLRRPVDLRAVVERAAEGMRLAHGGKEIILLLPEALPQVWADEDAVGGLVENLLENACRFARAIVTVGARAAGQDLVELSVSDDGPGLDPGRKERLFSWLSQAERRPDESGYKGTGLGLALCREVATAHGGNIWVESTLGRGATFRVTFPRSA